MRTRDLEKWNHCLVRPFREPPPVVIDDFERVLADADNERPLQEHLAASPVLLAPLAPPGAGFWCIDRPRLGAEYIPDFLLASSTSVGFKWAAVELENPTARALTKGALPARKLAEALGQLRDWRTWLTDNVGYARDELGLKDIAGTCEAFVVIGRRSTLDPNHIKKYRALSADGVTVMSYDRLGEIIRNSTRPGSGPHA